MRRDPLFAWTGTRPVATSRLFPEFRGRDPYPVSDTPEVQSLLSENSVVAMAVSGGKDSQAMAIRLTRHLDEICHSGPRVLIHSDLGRVEWRDSLPVCERLAKRLGLELIVVRRSAGDMMDRWETRWSNNLARYSDLSCVKVILPWSTPSMRFCTSELKTAVICSELARRFPGHKILSATGVRRAESSARAKMPILSLQPKLSRKNGTEGWNWNPIIEWETDEVYDYLEEMKEPLHEAYTVFGSSRVSCSFCIMGALDDLRAAARCTDNAQIYQMMVALEIRSTFALQGNQWLGDVAPHLLTHEDRKRLSDSKERARLRVQAESLISDRLLFQAGIPTVIPTQNEAEILASVRARVSLILGIEVGFTDPQSIVQRYRDLICDKADPSERAIPSLEEAFF